MLSVVIVACNDNTETETTDSSTLTSETTSTAPTATDAPVATDNVAMVAHAEAKLSGTYADTTVDGTVRFDSDSAGRVRMTLDITIPKKAGNLWQCISMNMAIVAIQPCLPMVTGIQQMRSMANGDREAFTQVISGM